MTRRELTKQLSATMLAGSTIWAVNPARPAPAFTVVMPDGTTFPLSKYHGKVCIVEFLFTTCSHCQHTAEVLSRLNTEYGPKGMQPVGVAWNDAATLLVPQFVQEHRVNFPVGVASREKVFEFLGYPAMTMAYVPQTAFLDRQGKIRYQSTPKVEEALHDEKKMRSIIEELLKEPAGAAKAASSTTARK